MQFSRRSDDTSTMVESQGFSCAWRNSELVTSLLHQTNTNLSILAVRWSSLISMESLVQNFVSLALVVLIFAALYYGFKKMKR